MGHTFCRNDLHGRVSISYDKFVYCTGEFMTKRVSRELYAVWKRIKIFSSFTTLSAFSLKKKAHQLVHGGADDDVAD